MKKIGTLVFGFGLLVIIFGTGGCAMQGGYGYYYETPTYYEPAYPRYYYPPAYHHHHRRGW